AFDIAGRGVADPAAVIRAVRLIGSATGRTAPVPGPSHAPAPLLASEASS
ncbi:MAG TPA: 3-isopropylmalate dehydrogenase, partial [Streptomyces sp.]|nr:3-isopropylmalate dehydrogenase [Streptomyces sp.]